MNIQDYTSSSLGGYDWTAPPPFLFVLAMSACDSHSSYEVGLQLVPFSRLSSPPGVRTLLTAVTINLKAER